MRGIVVAAVLGVLFVIAKANSAPAYHDDLQEYTYTPFWSDYNRREAQWQHCATTDYEKNIFNIAFNNWTSRWGHASYNTSVGPNCNAANDNLIRLWARSPAGIYDYCPGAVACFYPVYCKDTVTGNYYYHDGCLNFRLYRIIKAYILFDFVFFHEGLMYSAGKQIHLFIHELGHGMALAHHSNCGDGAMAPPPCTDTVDDGTYPNDVCVPDDRMGYGRSRC